MTQSINLCSEKNKSIHPISKLFYTKTGTKEKFLHEKIKRFPDERHMETLTDTFRHSQTYFSNRRE